MAFTVQDYKDLVRLLAEHPEWQLELRRLLIADDLQALREIVRDLAEAQRRSEERLSGVEERLSRLEEAVTALAEAQQRTEQALVALTKEQGRTNQSLAILTEAHRRLEDRVAHLIGHSLEQTYRERAAAYFGCLLRRPRAVSRETIDEMLEDRLPAEKLNDVLLLDLVVRGQPRSRPELAETWLAVEVSALVDEIDVMRASRRADLLRQAGCQAIPVVAGEGATSVAEEIARSQQVVVMLDGGVSFWEEALAAWGTG
jgi:hypothetical protein